MEIGELVAARGGVATRAELLAQVPRAEVDSALRDGGLISLSRGRYAVPEVEAAARAAHALGGVLCRESAALHHGWAVKTVPSEPHVSVPRNRKVPADRARGVQLHRDDLHPDDVEGLATAKELTLTQCLRSLPWDAALAVADSALRAGHVGLLRRVGASVRGPGAPQVRRAVSEARAEAANPFESVLRAIALDVEGLSVRPQPWVSGVRPDLVDEELRIVLEADSFEWHGSRAALRKDAKRYNLLVLDGWLVLRFAWEDVMFEQDYVRAVLLRIVDLVAGRTEVRCWCACHA